MMLFSLRRAAKKLDSNPALFLLASTLLLLRAWPRLFYPEVWAEDGTENLYGLINYGFIDVFRHVGGYLVLIPKLISFIALTISFSYYPLISILLAWAFTILVFFVIVKAPLYLRGQYFLAIACFLIPSDPECFGLPMYTYWWGALLLFVLVFWREDKGTIFRICILGLASLSSPVCLVTFPLFWVRAVLFKRHSTELWIAIFASLFCAIQLSVMAIYGKPAEFNFSSAYLVIPVFLGSYLIGNLNFNWNWIFGFMLLIFMIIGFIRNRSVPLGALYYLCFLGILMSIYRVDITILNPINAGPRYFFFPYILISWVLIQVLFLDTSFLIKTVAGILLSLSIINAIPHLGRTHDVLHWQDQITNCINSAQHDFPVHYAGSAKHSWSFRLTGKQCETLLQQDWLYRK